MRFLRSARAQVAREIGALRQDINKVRRAVTPTPARISHSLLILGAAVIVLSIAQWLPVLAGVIAGVFVIVYGLIFVDLDAGDARRRRR